MEKLIVSSLLILLLHNEVRFAIGDRHSDFFPQLNLPHHHRHDDPNHTHTSNKDHGIKAWIQGTKEKKESKEPDKIYFKDDSSAEIVVRDLKDIAVHCEAPFPVELVFDGYGDTRISATGTESSSETFQNDTHTIDIEKHKTYALIFRRSGQYTCRGEDEEHKHKNVSAYVYVPTQQLFIPSKTAILSSKEDKKLLIPCPVSEPNATVSLVKMQGEDTVVPVTPHFEYNPRKGFTHTGSDMNMEMEGTYFCIARYLTLQRALEFEVIKSTVECTRKCGANSKCHIRLGHQVCECNHGYESTLVSEQCLRPCHTDQDCPKMMNCVPQSRESFLPDILNLHDGRRGSLSLGRHGMRHAEEKKDDEVDGKRGECKNPCVFQAKCAYGGKGDGKGNEAELEQCQVVDHKPTCLSTGGLRMD